MKSQIIIMSLFSPWKNSDKLTMGEKGKKVYVEGLENGREKINQNWTRAYREHWLEEKHSSLKTNNNAER